MQRTCVWLADKERRGLKAISERKLVPVSALMRSAIEEFVEREKPMNREGSLGIIRYESAVNNVPDEYDVTFARYDSSGALRPRRLRGRDALISFLRGDVHLNDDVLSKALEKVDLQRGASVPNVIFSDDEIARLGFKP